MGGVPGGDQSSHRNPSSTRMRQVRPCKAQSRGRPSSQQAPMYPARGVPICEKIRRWSPPSVPTATRSTLPSSSKASVRNPLGSRTTTASPMRSTPSRSHPSSRAMSSSTIFETSANSSMHAACRVKLPLCSTATRTRPSTPSAWPSPWISIHSSSHPTHRTSPSPRTSVRSEPSRRRSPRCSRPTR